jgi:hypothetical protein
VLKPGSAAASCCRLVAATICAFPMNETDGHAQIVRIFLPTGSTTDSTLFLSGLRLARAVMMKKYVERKPKPMPGKREN